MDEDKEPTADAEQTTVILRTGSTISVTDNTTEEAYHGQDEL